MSTEPRRSIPRNFEGRATAYDLVSRFALDRYPLSLAPGSPTRVNQERLPDPAQLADMELAFRGATPDAEARRDASSLFVPMLLLGFLVTLGVLIVAALVPFIFGLQVLGAVALGYMILRIYQTRRLTINTVIRAILIPLVALALLHVLSYLIARRMVGTFAFGGLGILLLVLCGAKPAAFYFDWLYTFAPLTPKQRRAREPVALRPNLVLFTVIVIVAALVGWLSTTLAIIAVAALCAFWCRNERFGWGLIPKALDLLVPYLGYGTTTLGTPALTCFPQYPAPGVWLPPDSARRRKRYLLAILTAVYLPLTIGLCYYMPGELLMRRLQDIFLARLSGIVKGGPEMMREIDPDFDFDKAHEAVFETPFKGTSRQKLEPKETEARYRAACSEILRPLFRNRPHMVPYLAALGLGDGNLAWVWLVPLAIVIGMPLNTLVLLAVFRRPIVETYQRRQDLEEAARNTDRPEWQWYVDRIRESQHEATEPLGRKVREAEHLFLGVEPFYRFPLLLDKAILDEHAYFVGETGSGKTALGIMPILIQLIRGHVLPRQPAALSATDAPETEAPAPPATEQPPAGAPGANMTPSELPNDTRVPETAAPSPPLTMEKPLPAVPAVDEAAPVSPPAVRAGETVDEQPPVADTGSPVLTSVNCAPETAAAADAAASAAPPQSSTPAITPPPPMVIIDLKGDPALFHTIREECEARRRALDITDPKDPRHGFRFFTLEMGRATHFFNPFSDLRSSSCSVMQLCHLILDSLSLSHGEGYGRSYYSRRNRHLLLATLTRTQPPPKSFDELYQIMRELAHSQEHRECFELISTIHALTQYPQLATFQPLQHPEDAIHMPSVIEHSQTVYFWLPAAIESISVREVAKLAVYCLLTAAIDRQRQRRDENSPRRTHLVIDEFQRIAGENFKVILEQARSFGISVMLANQTQGDLKTHDLDLRPAIRSNTRFKQYFALGDPGEIKDLKDLSGEEIATLHSWTTDGSWPDHYEPRILPRLGMIQKTESEFIKSRLMVNDILAAGDHPLHSIVHVSRGSGYTQFAGLPIPVCSTWAMHEHVYRRRQREPWPTRDEYELETTESEKSTAQVDLEAEERVAVERALIDQQIREMFPDVDQEGTQPAPAAD